MQHYCYKDDRLIPVYTGTNGLCQCHPKRESPRQLYEKNRQGRQDGDSHLYPMAHHQAVISICRSVINTGFIGRSFTLGAEHLSFTSNYTASDFDSATGEFETGVTTVQFKKYFNYSAPFRPFIGIGLGMAAAEFKGPIERTDRGHSCGRCVSVQARYHIYFWSLQHSRELCQHRGCRHRRNI